jgi:hypothetical protein
VSNAETKEPAFEQWAIVELMGHIRMAGRVTEEQHFGATLGRIDMPKGDGFVTQFFGGSSVYRITPTTEDVARAVADRNIAEPVHRWELPVSTSEKPAPVEDHAFVPDEDGDCDVCGHDIGSAEHYDPEPF